MTFKINISEKDGKTFHLEAEAEGIIENELAGKIDGKEISLDLEGYEFEITGASDNAGFTAMKDVEGVGLKKVLLTYGKGLKKKPRREGKKKLSNNTPKGLRLRRTVRGKVISPAITQINLKVIKEGGKKLSEVFPDQNKAPEPEVKETPQVEVPKEEVNVETPVEVKETPQVEEKVEVPEEEKKEELKVEEEVKEETETKVE
jgi:small subunit ribosomal protein S6e